ncbi:acyl-phosphate glycerol 3-phosphate acyltransferase [Halobacteroides halobius DSM 5150]|uniref:Glycerol-3-phosphate acyltransferase n=1 Tax=Halobacteroides halobius (strain ATCC 35273 / DSM 5150 / MD-1) TaxID=748449 RepID=L0KAY2_HALHC|nr:glycerol-3-phosphate 1-O-acyltransferase PlsY [Halobacteroides halobius]AGB41529.1 acyl-phosphate glycerol 3-phosphate acyltransferase [Halobacteroides halobius DSM 5150]
MFKVVLVMLVSYLLGSIPFGLLISKMVKGQDIRKYGSGNIGATNAFRLMGLKMGALVALLDISKGVLAVKLADIVLGDQIILLLLAGLFSVAGHNLSIFLGFSGGRGVATSVGVLGTLAPVVVVIVFLVWLSIVLLTKYVSLGSIIGSALIPVLMLWFNKDTALVIFSFLIAAFVIYSHRPNIKRLLAGEENKVGMEQNSNE